ncbi:MAG: hypothetical protein ACI89Z_001449 [Porticoccus sp.]|jgi:hypothetical protein
MPVLSAVGAGMTPYTGKIFYEAQKMDIDHLVPLKWAWVHCAYNWSYDKRTAFAKVMSHLMLGVIALTVEQLIRFLE